MGTCYSHGDGVTESKEDDAAVTAAKLAYAGSSPSEIDSHIIALRDQLNSTDEQVRVRAAMQIRRLLSIKPNPPIDSVIRAGVVPRLMYFLQVNSNHTLQFEAAWALTNIASGTSEHTRCVVEQGAVPIFIRLLPSPSEDVCEQAAWALGNIAGDSVAFRDTVLEAGAVPAFLALAGNFTEHTRVSTIRNCTWALSNLCRFKPRPNFATVSPVLPFLARSLNSKDDETLTNTCLALSCLSDGSKEAIDQVLSRGVAARLVELLGEQVPSAQAPALQAVGNIVTGTDLQTQVIIDLKVIPALLAMLDHPKQNIRKVACWTLSNITAGTPEQIQRVLSAGVIPKLIQILLSGDLDIQKEATWAISNATSRGYPNQILKLARLGCIAPLCGMLDCQDIIVVNRALKGLENFLKTGRKLLTAEVEDGVRSCDGISSIERLQNRHGRDEQISKRAAVILQAHFSDKERKSVSLGTGDKLVLREKGEPESKRASAAAAAAVFSAPISTELAFAIESGQVLRATQLLQGVENINTLGIASAQLAGMLHTACGRGQADILSLLLSRGADVDAKDWEDKTPLHIACACGCLQIASLLVDKGASVYAETYSGVTPLQLCPTDEFRSAVQGDRYKLYLACKDGDEPAVVRLLEAGSGTAGTVDVNCELILSFSSSGDEITSRPLLAACSSGNASLVTYLLSRGADVQAKNSDGSTALHIACAGGHLQIASFLVEKGASVDAKDNAGKTPLQLCSTIECRCATQGNRGKLYQACQDGDEPAAVLLLEAGAEGAGAVDVNCEVTVSFGSNGAKITSRPLLAACSSGSLSLVTYLLSRGADVQAKDSAGKTPLHIACAGGHLQIASFLVEKGAKVDAKDTAGKTPLHIACACGHLQITSLLIKKGASVFAKDDWDKSPLHTACAGGRRQIASLLVEKGASVYAEDCDGTTPLQVCPTDWFCCIMQGDRGKLYLACQDGDEPAVVRLLEAGSGTAGTVDVNCELILSFSSSGDEITSRPLLAACSSDNASLVTYLLSRGADVQAKNSDGSTALHIACAGGHLQIVSLLVEKGASVDAEDNAGKTSPQLCPTDKCRCALQGRRFRLYQACKDGDEQTAVRLLETGSEGAGAVDVNCEVVVSFGSNGDKTTSRPLLAACSSGSLSLVRYLLSRGADVQAKDSGRSTALHIACAGGHLQIASLLVEKVAKVDARNSIGSTALHIACTGGHLQIASLLIEKGASVDAKDSNGMTSLLLCPTDEFRCAIQGDSGKLYRACKDGNAAEAMRLLDAGVDMNCMVVGHAYIYREGQSSTPLHAAVMQGYSEVAALLVSRGANVHALNSSGRSPLELCDNDDLRIALQGDRGRLYQACKDGDTAEAMRLLDAGVDVNCMVMGSVTAGGVGVVIMTTPLHAAVMQGFSEVAALLVSRGANIEAADKSGCTPLHSACRTGHLDVARLLIDNGAAVSAVAKEAWTPLHFACRHNRSEVAAFLVSRGASIHAQNSFGQSPLELCKSDDLCFALQGDRGRLYRACKDGDAAEAMRLLDAGVDVNCMVVVSLNYRVRGQLTTPLHAAVMQGYSEVAALLVSRGADPTAKNSSGLTPLAARQEANALQYKAVISDMVRANASNDITEENYYLLQWLCRIRRVGCARGLRIGFVQPYFLWSIYRPMMPSAKHLKTSCRKRIAISK